MNIELFPYQQDGVNEIITKFFEEKYKRILYQLSTGGGKTFVFSFLTKKWVEDTKKKVVILCHKTELIDQTIASLQSIGITAEPLTKEVKKLKHNCDAYVCMIETANNRLKKDPNLFKNIGLVIADECHILIFDKVYSYFPDANILGCSATPVTDKKETFYKCKYCKSESPFASLCCGSNMKEWVRPFTLSRIYDEIVVGITIQELIKLERLVPEISFVKNYTDNSSLQLGSDGDFTAESMDLAYGNASATFDCLLNYQEICEHKKTMIFNGTTSTNKIVYQRFLEAGYNVRMYDSINSKPSERKEIVDWFENTPDAILCNVGCFTTGFDVTDVEAIILNRPTNSLSLFLQMVGRGGRVTKKIFKPHFILIDGGGNIERFNEWSDDSRDWRELFFNGVGKSREKKPKSDVTDVQECDECGFLMEKTIDVCPNCGHEFIKKAKGSVEQSDEVFTPIKEINPPDAKKIHKYVVSLKENVNFAFKILQSQIIDMFKFYRVHRDLFIKANNNGELKRKVLKMIDNCYYYLIAMDDIKTDRPKRISTLYNNIRHKLNELYKYQPEETPD